jgi:predicted DNA-binding protein with PD1-like motif
MRYSEAGIGRIFIIRLEDGDRLPDSIEQLAREKAISHGLCLLLGGVDGGSRLVVGPADGKVMPPEPVQIALDGVHEALGAGTIIPDEEGNPILHMHAACGRDGETKTGCVRPGVDIWKVGEVVILELTGSRAVRARDSETGFDLLNP